MRSYTPGFYPGIGVCTDVEGLPEFVLLCMTLGAKGYAGAGIVGVHGANLLFDVIVIGHNFHEAFYDV